jgi:hypothetical protein
MESAKRTFFLVIPKEFIRLRPPAIGFELVVGLGERVTGDDGGDE